MSLAKDIWDFISSFWRKDSRNPILELIPLEFKSSYSDSDIREMSWEDFESLYNPDDGIYATSIRSAQSLDTPDYMQIHAWVMGMIEHRQTTWEKHAPLKRSQDLLKPKIKKAQLLRRRSAS